jgi:hypothetical protein
MSPRHNRTRKLLAACICFILFAFVSRPSFARDIDGVAEPAAADLQREVGALRAEVSGLKDKVRAQVAELQVGAAKERGRRVFGEMVGSLLILGLGFLVLTDFEGQSRAISGLESRVKQLEQQPSPTHTQILLVPLPGDGLPGGVSPFRQPREHRHSPATRSRRAFELGARQRARETLSQQRRKAIGFGRSPRRIAR